MANAHRLRPAAFLVVLTAFGRIAQAGPHDDAIWNFTDGFDAYALGEVMAVSSGVWGTDNRPNQMMVVNTTPYNAPNCLRMMTVHKDGWFGYDPAMGYTPSSGIFYFHFRVRSPVGSETTTCFRAQLASNANVQEFGGNPFGEWLGDETRIRPTIQGNNGPYQSLTDGNWHEADMKHVHSTGVTTWWWDGAQIFSSSGTPNPPSGTVMKMQFETMPDDRGFQLLIDDIRLGSNVASPGPGPVTNVVVTPGNNQLRISWHNPSSSFTGTMIRTGPSWPADWADGTLVIDRPAAPNTDDSYTITGLANGSTYKYTLFSHDNAGHYGVKVGATGTPAPLGPGSVTNFTATKGSGQNALSWHNPADASFVGTMIRYKTTGYPANETDGTLLVDKANASNSNDNYTHTGTNNSLTYYYGAFAHDSVPNYASPALSAATDPIVGYFRINPNNPHYFQEANTGKPVLLTGYQSIVPDDTSYDYVAGLDGINDLKRHRIGYSRVWDFTPWAGSFAVWPWGRSNTPGAPMGGNKFDFNIWNPTYWSRLGDAMSRANAGNIYAEIHIFDRVGMFPAAPDRWFGNPWASDNNINNLELPGASGAGVPQFYFYVTKPNMRTQQERYIRKMIDETIAYPNVIYEIENEHLEDTSPDFGTHYAQFVKSYLAATYPSQPRLVSYNSLETDLESMYTVPAIDMVNVHYGQELDDNGSISNPYLEGHWSLNKAMSVDEFANGLTDMNILRSECWCIITSGGNFHIEDADPAAQPYDVVANIRSFLSISGWDFIHAAPNKSLIASGDGFCMAQPGVEYLCFFPFSGNHTLTMPAGSYRAEWWNNWTGGFYNTASFSHGGGGRTFTSPDANDWVLHVATTPLPTTILQSKLGGSITIDGNSADWNTAAFTTRIRGGDTGTGDLAIAGFDTNGVCYTGGHWTGASYPPDSAADHAAKIYSRHDATYLYLLFRIDDSEIQTPNPTASNTANDCVEIYIDPGNAGGSVPIANSTTDCELVIDAANRKNVYVTTAGYATQILSGVTSAVTTDATGWWLEVRVAKAAFSPAIPSGAGTIGIEFAFRDNDAISNAVSSMYTWRDAEVSTSFPSKIPDRWGKLSLLGALDVTPPGPVTGVSATPGPQQITLGWTNPSDTDFTGTLIRFRTDTYPTGPTDGNLVIDKSNAPASVDNYVHSGLTAGTTYYYSAFAHDAALNYAAGIHASATVPLFPGPATSPNPANLAVNVATSPTLSWTPGSNTVSHSIYFGALNPLTFQGNQAGATFNPGQLAEGITYYWRIDEVNGVGTTTGTVWSFTTQAGSSGMVSIDLGSPDAPSGITHPQGGDGDTVAATIGGRSARRNSDPNDDYYFYFDVSDTFAFQANHPDLYITIQYYDAGTGSLALQYDSNNGSDIPAIYKSAGFITLAGSNTWKQYTFHVTDAYFGTRQNGVGDFRVFGGVGNTFYLDVERVAYTPPPVVAKGDFNHDGDVDLSDFGHLQVCMSGPNIPYGPGCQDADLIVDNAVSQADTDRFLACFNGADRPPACP